MKRIIDELKGIVAQFPEFLRQEPFGWDPETDHEYWMSDEEREMMYRARYFVAPFQWFWWAVSVLPCVFVGHDLEDDSYGGPEGGCMAAHCTRCGYGFHETLY